MNKSDQSKKPEKKFSLLRAIMRSGVAVLVAAVFLMAGSCPGGGSGNGPAPHILVLEGAPPGTTIILPVVGVFDFGDFLMWGTRTQTFTISSVGDLSLALTGSPLVDTTGDSEFSVSQQPPIDAIVPGDTTDFIIEFNTSSGGTYSADVTIASNDPDVPSYTFEVKGRITSS